MTSTPDSGEAATRRGRRSPAAPSQSPTAGSLTIAVLIAAFAAAYLVRATQLPGQARMLPLLFAAVVTAMAVFDIGRQALCLTAKRRARPAGALSQDQVAPGTRARRLARRAAGPLSIVAGPLAALAAGFVIGLGVYTLLAFIFLAKQPAWRAVLLAAATTAGVYFLFTSVLGMQVFTGLIISFP